MHPMSIDAAIQKLPENYHCIDQDRLAVVAPRQRSMSDLRWGQKGVNGHLALALRINSSLTGEGMPDIRHMNRGVALAYLLLRESTIEDSLNTGPFPEASNALRQARRGVLMGISRRFSPLEMGVQTDNYRTQVDAVLAKAGFAGKFPIAVNYLNGEGLEEPTDLMAAKYGAAIMAISTGPMVE
jgi:hypothetical protein